MNAERLHAIVDALRAEISKTSYPDLLEQLVSGLRGAVESPNQPGPQEQISSAREGLNAVLSEAASNEFSPAWREELREMGIINLLGEPLAEDLERILSANEITPSTAADEIAEIQQRVQSLVAALEQASSSLDFFEIGRERLSPGEFEIGFMIPRVEVDGGLEKLGKEFVRLKRIIAPFSELAGQSRPEFRVRSISSSEFQVFLESTPATAVLFTAALERVLAIYSQILDIRLKHRELAEKDQVPDEYLKGLADYATGLMDAKTHEIAESLVAKEGAVDEGRDNELRTELRLQLNALAERIDRGYNVEVRAGELPEPTDDDDDDEGLNQATRVATKAVLDAQKKLEFMNVSGKPILSLETPDESSEGTATGDGSS